MKFICFTLALASISVATTSETREPTSIEPFEDSISSPSNNNTPIDPTCCQVLSGTSNYRQLKGLAPLKGDRRLDQAARKQCELMLQAKELAHSIDGSKPSSLDEDAGYTQWTGVAQNIYSESKRADNDAERPLNAWFESPGHELNIVGDFDHLGVAFCGDGETTYWVQNFGKGDTDLSQQYTPDSCSTGVIEQEQIILEEPLEETSSYESTQTSIEPTDPPKESFQQTAELVGGDSGISPVQYENSQKTYGSKVEAKPVTTEEEPKLYDATQIQNNQTPQENQTPIQNTADVVKGSTSSGENISQPTTTLEAELAAATEINKSTPPPVPASLQQTSSAINFFVSKAVTGLAALYILAL